MWYHIKVLKKYIELLIRVIYNVQGEHPTDAREEKGKMVPNKMKHRMFNPKLSTIYKRDYMCIACKKGIEIEQYELCKRCEELVRKTYETED